MTLRLIETSPSGERLKSTPDANGEHIIHVNVDAGGGGGPVDQGAPGALPWLVSDTAILAQVQTLNSLIPSIYDYISMSYTGTNLTGVVFKNGGAGGAVVSTLTLVYDGSDNLITVTKT